MILTGFFNSVNGDRRYRAEDFANYFSNIVGTGIFADTTDNLQVSQNTGMQLIIKSGRAILKGYSLTSTSNISITVPDAHSSLNRIDRVVVRLDLAVRDISIVLIPGVPAATPSPPQLTRNTSVYELCLATISVSAGTTAITQAMITDTRGDSSVCGYVYALAQEIDTTGLFAQYDAKLTQLIEDMGESEHVDVIVNSDAVSIKGTPVSDVAPTLLSPVLAYNGTNYTPGIIGGENLIENADFSQGLDGWYSNDISKWLCDGTDTNFKHNRIYSSASGLTADSTRAIYSNIFIPNNASRKYTFSGYVYIGADCDTVSVFQIEVFNTTNTNIIEILPLDMVNLKGQGWQKVSLTFTIASATFGIVRVAFATSRNGLIALSEPMVQEGTIPTAFSIKGVTSVIKSIQRGIGTINAGTSVTIAINAVNPAKADIRVNGVGSYLSGGIYPRGAYLSSYTATSITVATANVSETAFDWQVIEYK